MGNQTSLEGRRDRLGAIVYSELRKKLDADGATVDDDDPSSRRAAVVSHWLGASRPTRLDRERPAPAATALSPEAGSDPGAQCARLPNGYGGDARDGSSCGVSSSSEIVELGLASDALQLPHLEYRTVADDPLMRPGDLPLDDDRATSKPKRCGRRGDGRRLAICATPSGTFAASSESYRSGCVVSDLHDPGCRLRERRFDTSSSEEEAPGAADSAFYDGDGASGQTTPLLAGLGDCCYSHPLADLLPSAALPRARCASLAAGEDLFSRLQSELDAVYAEARDIELCLGQLSQKRPPPLTGLNALRPLRSVSFAETRSEVLDPCSSSDAYRAASAAVRRHTTISTHQLRLSAPEVLTSWKASDGDPLSTARPKAAARELAVSPAADRLTVGDDVPNGDGGCDKLDVSSIGDAEYYVNEACPLMVHATHRLGNHGHPDKGYNHISEDLGLRSMYAVRPDLYCAVRACLAGALLQGIAVYDHLQPAEKLLKALHECFENHDILQKWESTESEQLADGVVARLEPYLVILYDLCYQALVCPAAVREYVINRLVNDMARDRACMEAVKVLMMLRAYELHQVMAADSSGISSRHVPAYAHLLFADDAYRDPDCLFGNHVSGVGIRHRLAQDVMPLLADVLGIGLLVLWPSRFGRTDFAFEFNVEVSGPRRDRLVSLVADDDGFYGVVVP